ncbi:SDR family oxidoreductase [Streptomyces hoynatensis]|uniref:NAD-dependent epimerase/dehydratase family protein n=1 Tax=Streptomyces hoynatensis TaxID=1141874 RepID=A0A3A9ZBZ8_9ACTN|nr:NAD(P)H-binding protein [Streptomyces hoynatensis]RKN44867.1 NAD-dependent epimerase/dehydratase family protein [Streptomyces hoynatensis]
MRVLVTGASGRLGTALLPRLAEGGWTVRAMSRRERQEGAGAGRDPGAGGVEWVRADLATGAGVEAALRGADAVVHLAAAPYRGRYTARVEVAGTERLLAAAAAAGVGHVLYTSIVGCDRVPWGYFRTKAAAESVLAGGGVPWSVLRATQFHSFLDRVLTLGARGGLLVADRRIPAQPVDVAEVAARLAERVADGPSGAVEDFAGPEVLGMEEAARQWLEARGKRRPVLRVRVPGGLGRAFRAGHLTNEAAPTGRVTWRSYLAATGR